jgi:hypothetical protein
LGANPSWVQAPINGVSNPIDVDYIQSFAFRDRQNYALILFNLHLTDTLAVAVSGPFDATASATRYQIAPASIHDDNEEAENVVIESGPLGTGTPVLPLALPPHSLTVVTWEPQKPLPFMTYLPFLIVDN